MIKCKNRLSQKLAESKMNPQVFITEVVRLDFLADVHLQENRWGLVLLRPSDSVQNTRKDDIPLENTGTSSEFFRGLFQEIWCGAPLCYSERVYRGNLWFAGVMFPLFSGIYIAAFSRCQRQNEILPALQTHRRFIFSLCLLPFLYIWSF